MIWLSIIRYDAHHNHTDDHDTDNELYGWYIDNDQVNNDNHSINWANWYTVIQRLFLHTLTY